MLIIIRLLIVILLLVIFVQDMRWRAVYWISFPLLIILFIAEKTWLCGLSGFWQPVLFNTGFIALQLGILWAWFSFKNRRVISITGALLGLGDILLLISIAFYFSVVNFITFYVISLLLIVIGWLMWQAVTKKDNKLLPLAGLQALLLAVCMAIDWFSPQVSLTDDGWILNLITI